MDWRRMYSKPGTYLKNGHVHIHRTVAETFLGRELSESEVVHHIDNDRKNNNPENLAVFPSQSEHARCHFGKMDEEELNRYRLIPFMEVSK